MTEKQAEIVRQAMADSLARKITDDEVNAIMAAQDFGDLPLESQKAFVDEFVESAVRNTSYTINMFLGESEGGTDSREIPARVTDANKGKPFQPEREAQNDQVERNLRGRELEREGLIDDAIELYQANVRGGFDGDWPYYRLAVIYRGRKDYASEIAILERAVEVFEALVEMSPRSDVQPKLAKFRERLRKARQLAGECAQG
jgi:tetratricopeptide (TPR) repeat protein